jgi:hypothetical protein
MLQRSCLRSSTRFPPFLGRSSPAHVLLLLLLPLRLLANRSHQGLHKTAGLLLSTTTT